MISKYYILGFLILFMLSAPLAGAYAYDVERESGLVFTPGKGYSWPAMGAPKTRYMYDPEGRQHLVEVDPFTLQVKPYFERDNETRSYYK